MSGRPSGLVGLGAEVAARAQVLRRLELQVAAASTAATAATTRPLRSGPAASGPAPAPYAPGDDARLHRLEPHRAIGRRRRCGRPRPTASSRPGSSWTARPASTSARPLREARRRARRHGRVRHAAARAAATGSVLVVAGADGLRHRPARPGRAAFMAALAAVHDTPRRGRARRRTAPPWPTPCGALARLRAAAARSWSSRTSSTTSGGRARCGAGPPPRGRRRARDRPARAGAPGGRHARRRRHRDRPSALRADRLGGTPRPVRGRPPARAHAAIAHDDRTARAPRTCTCRPTATGSPTSCAFAARRRALPAAATAHRPASRPRHRRGSARGGPTMTFLSAWRLVLLVLPSPCSSPTSLVQRRRHTQVAAVHQRRPARLGGAASAGLAAAPPGGGAARRPRGAHPRVRPAGAGHARRPRTARRSCSPSTPPRR